MKKSFSQRDRDEGERADREDLPYKRRRGGPYIKLRVSPSTIDPIRVDPQYSIVQLHGDTRLGPYRWQERIGEAAVQDGGSAKEDKDGNDWPGKEDECYSPLRTAHSSWELVNDAQARRAPHSALVPSPSLTGRIQSFLPCPWSRIDRYIQRL